MIKFTVLIYRYSMRNKHSLLNVVIVATLLFLINPFVFAQEKSSKEDHRFEMSKQIDIFNVLLKELDLFYVDTIDIKKSVELGINSMLAGLDPYTEYISENDMSGFNTIITGEYAGVGSLIRKTDEGIVLDDVFENQPADLGGLKSGDILIKVDDTDVSKMENDKVSSLLKGAAGTRVQLTVRRYGNNKPLVFDVIRKKVHINQVPYYGIVGDSIGYIKLLSFTDKCADEFREAFMALKEKQIKGLIIDLKDNGGGVMASAIDILSLFLPKGTEVVKTKGKMEKINSTYRTEKEPMDEKIPLVVLINGASASASEILAGTLQDLDRGVLVGARSFGKGLVQSPRQLPFGGMLKLTTSKYYIPSGRCIQQLDYSHRNPDGSVAQKPDSLTNVFKTKNGREVRDGGGIRPDISVEEEKFPTLFYYLQRKFAIYDFVTQYVSRHEKIASPDEFAISDEEYENFKTFMRNRDFEYDMQSSSLLKRLKEITKIEGYDELAADELKSLEEKIKPDLEKDLERFKDGISTMLNREIVKRYYYIGGLIRYTLRDNEEVKEAVRILTDHSLYEQTLMP